MVTFPDEATGWGVSIVAEQVLVDQHRLPILRRRSRILHPELDVGSDSVWLGVLKALYDVGPALLIERLHEGEPDVLVVAIAPQTHKKSWDIEKKHIRHR